VNARAEGDSAPNKEEEAKKRKEFGQKMLMAASELGTVFNEGEEFVLFAFSRYGSGCAANEERSKMFPLVAEFIMEQLISEKKEG
jgi:hypothetical protein